MTIENSGPIDDQEDETRRERRTLLANKHLEFFDYVRATVTGHDTSNGQGNAADGAGGRMTSLGNTPLVLDDLSDGAPWTTALASVLQRTLVPGATFDPTLIWQCSFECDEDGNCLYAATQADPVRLVTASFQVGKRLYLARLESDPRRVMRIQFSDGFADAFVWTVNPAPPEANSPLRQGPCTRRPKP